MNNIQCNILTYHPVVKEIQCDLQNGEDNRANSRCDDQGVGGGEGGLLLLLGPDGAVQQLVSSFDVVIFKKVTEIFYVFIFIFKIFYP